MSNILWVIVQFTSIMGFGMLWYTFLKWTPEESICMSIVSSMSLIFVGAYVGKGEIALLALLFVSLAGAVAGVIRERKHMFAFFTPGVVILIIVFIYGMISFNGLIINNWDELHQWGKSVNYMLQNNGLPYGEGFNGEEVLLTSTTLFHYYFCKLSKTMTGVITESNMYVSNLVLWFSAAVLPLSGLKWSRWKACFSYGAVVFLSMNVLFVQPYFNIYCDQPLCMWAGAMIAWIIFCEKKKYSQVFVVMSLLHIAMMKNMMGPLFGIVVVLALLIRYIMDFEKDLKGTIRGIWKEMTVGKVIYGVLCITSIFALTLIWSWTIRGNALIRGDGIVKTADDRLSLTLKSGVSKWFQPVNSSSAFPNLTYFVFLVVSIVIAVWFSKAYLSGKRQKQYRVLIGFYGIGFIIFFMVMMYAYLTTFSYADSIITGSLNRYFSDYMMLGIITLILPAFREGEESRGWHMNTGAGVLIVFFVLSTTNGFANKALGMYVKEGASYQEKNKMKEYKKNALSLMDEPGKIYMINQNSNGIFTVAADYTFEDLLDRTNMCYYFTPKEENIVGLRHVNIRALPEILLDGYEYLWIYKTDSYFNEKAFSILKIVDPQAGDFYKIENRNGILKLEYLGNLREEQ